MANDVHLSLPSQNCLASVGTYDCSAVPGSFVDLSMPCLPLLERLHKPILILDIVTKTVVDTCNLLDTVGNMLQCAKQVELSV